VAIIDNSTLRFSALPVNNVERLCTYHKTNDISSTLI
jgi:hypothetical protein